MSDETNKEERRYQVIGAVFLIGIVLLLAPFLFDRVSNDEIHVEVPTFPDRSEYPQPLEESYTPEPVVVEEEVMALAEPLIEATDDEGFRTDTGVRFGDPAFLPANDPRTDGWSTWGIQVGSFGDIENAYELRRLLRADGHHVSLSEVKVNGERVTRVAVGPVLRQADAERLRDEFAENYGLDSILVKFET